MHGGQGHGTKEMKELKKENMRKNEEFRTTNGEKKCEFHFVDESTLQPTKTHSQLLVSNDG